MGYGGCEGWGMVSVGVEYGGCGGRGMVGVGVAYGGCVGWNSHCSDGDNGYEIQTDRNTETTVTPRE